MSDKMTETHAWFAGWCRSIRRGYPRAGWAECLGLNGRAMQDLEQGRCLPSRSLVVLLKAVERDRDFMRQVARDARPELELLEKARSSRNF